MAYRKREIDGIEARDGSINLGREKDMAFIGGLCSGSHSGDDYW